MILSLGIRAALQRRWLTVSSGHLIALLCFLKAGV
jgi:hypothetical protein